MRKLHKSSRDSQVEGVCAGIAETYNIDPTIVRVIVFLLIWFYGTGILIYFLLAFILPYGNEVGKYDENGNWTPKGDTKSDKEAKE